MFKRFYSNPAAALFIVFSILGAGIYQFFNVPVALYPNTSKPELQLRFFNAPGTPDSFRKEFGEAMEASLGNIVDLSELETTYDHSYAKYAMKFAWGTSLLDARSQVETAISQTASQMPKENRRYYIREGSSEGAVVYLSVSSNEAQTIEQLYQIVDDRIRPSLERIAGVAGVWVSKPYREQVVIELNPTLLLQAGIAHTEVARKISAYANDRAAGSIDLSDKGGNNYVIQLMLKPERVEDLRRIPVSTQESKTYFLQDIATVSLEQKANNRIFRGNGLDSVVIGVFPATDANVARVSESAVNITDSRIKDIGSGLKSTILTDPSQFIKEAVRNVMFAVLIGMVVAMLTLFLFTGSARNACVIGVSIPVSLCGGIILMSLFGIELNLISLGAMSLSVGMVVDGSIVVFENIIRRFEVFSTAGMQLSLKQKISEIIGAVAEVRLAVVVSILTTIIVFLPLYFTSPLAAAILGDLALVMVFVLSLSVFVTIFIVPPLVLVFRVHGNAVLDSKMGLSRIFYLMPLAFKRLFDLTQSLYVKALESLLNQMTLKVTGAAIVTAAFVFSLYLLKNEVKREIMGIPDTDKVILFLNSNVPVSGPQEMLDITKQHEEKLNDSLSDFLASYLSITNDDSTMMILSLKDKSQVSVFKEKLETLFVDSAKISYRIRPWNPTSLEIPEPALIHAVVDAGSDAENRKILKKLHDIFVSFDEVGNTRNHPRMMKSDNVQIGIDEKKLDHLARENRFELRLDQVLATVRIATSEMEVETLQFQEGKNNKVVLKYPEGMVNSSKDLGNLIFRVGEFFLPLRLFSEIDIVRSWQDMFFKDSFQLYETKAFVKQKHKTERVQIETKLIDAVRSDGGVDVSTIEFLDTDIEINANLYSLMQALALALILIVGLVLIMFGSVFQTMVVFAAIPLGLIGVGVALYGFDSTLSVNSMLGLILLCGTAVNNSILFVDFYNQSLEGNAGKAASKKELIQLIIDTGRLRFRAISITTFTTILGMLPIAFGFGSGGEILQPLGIAICGGLGISTFLTLFVVPLLLSWGHSFSLPRGTSKSVAVLIMGLFFALQATPGNGDTQQVKPSNLKVLLDSILNPEVYTVLQAISLQDPELFELAAKMKVQELEQDSQHSYWPTTSLRHEQSKIEVRDERFSSTISRDSALSFGAQLKDVLNRGSKDSSMEIQKQALALQVAQRRRVALVGTIKDYFRWLFAIERFEIAQKHLKVMQQLYRDMQKAFSRGTVAKTEILRVELRLERSKLTMDGLQRAVDATKEKFCFVAKESLCKEVIQLPVKPILNDRLSVLIGRVDTFRKRIRYFGQGVAELRLAQLDHLLQEKQYPDLTIFAELGISTPDSGGSLNSRYAVGVNMILFDKDRSYEKRQQMETLEGARKAESIKSIQLNEEVKLQMGKVEDLEVELKGLLSEKSKWEQLSNLSKKSFEKGLIDSTKVTEDLLSVLEVSNRLSSLRLEIVLQSVAILEYGSS